MRFRDPFCVDPITRHRIFYFLDAVVRHLGFLELKFLTATHFGYMFQGPTSFCQILLYTGNKQNKRANKNITTVLQTEFVLYTKQLVPMLLNSQDCPFCWRHWPPSDACFLEPTQLHVPNDISIGTTVFARLNNMSERHTERQTQRPQGSHRPQTLPPVLL